jgi:hypothetical protein
MCVFIGVCVESSQDAQGTEEAEDTRGEWERERGEHAGGGHVGVVTCTLLSPLSSSTSLSMKVTPSKASMQGCREP